MQTIQTNVEPSNDVLEGLPFPPSVVTKKEPRKRSMAKPNETIWKKIVSDYESLNISQKELAEKYGTTTHWVREALVEAGLSKDNKNTLRQRRKEQLKNLGFFGHLKEAFKSLIH